MERCIMTEWAIIRNKLAVVYKKASMGFNIDR